MNPEQTKSVVRGLLQTFGGLIAGFFAARGWFSVEQVKSVLASETFIGAIVSVVGLIWGLFTHTKTNAVAVVAAMPEVAKVEVKPTIAGKDLAASVGSTPEATVVVAKRGEGAA